MQLKKLTDLNDFEQLIIKDLIELLEKKGFLRFSGFEIAADDISMRDYWEFKPPKTVKKFSFELDKVVVEGKYYEFG